MKFKRYLVESVYTNKIQGIPKNAFDYFNKYQKEFDVKDLGFKKFNISKVTVSTSALSTKQRSTLVDKFGFNNDKQIKELKKLIPLIKNKWSEIQKMAHMETYGEEPKFGSYKVSGIGDSNYSNEYKAQLRTLAHMETIFKSALIGHEGVKNKNIMEEWNRPKGEFAGWIAIYGGKKLEIKKTEAKDLYGAKQLAIKKLKVPKSKTGLLAIDVAYDD
jgi:hypothetical protein